jgi:hypothetical protein
MHLLYICNIDSTQYMLINQVIPFLFYNMVKYLSKAITKFVIKTTSEPNPLNGIPVCIHE